MATATLSPAPIRPAAVAVRGTDPAWDDARRLMDTAQAGARAWLRLGDALEQLRTEFLSKGGRPKNSPHDAASFDERGWQAKVRHELGISDDTARRWMLDGQRHRQLLQIANGEVKQIEDQKVTPEVREKAKEALESIQLDPSVRPARVWAGVWGASATKGKQRAAVDHARNIARGLTALATSLPHWSSLKPEERAALERGWAQRAASRHSAPTGNSRLRNCLRSRWWTISAASRANPLCSPRVRRSKATGLSATTPAASGS